MKYKKFAVAAAIILVGSLTAGGIVYFTDTKTAPTAGGAALQSGKSASSISPDNILPIAPERDHIFGDPNAPVKIVEYSDTECPYCKQFHLVMHQVVNEYDGQVAWVYRHFPLYQIHPKAPKEAEAAECAGELGGEPKFWEYLDRIFEITPSNNNLDPAKLPEIAEYVGLDKTKFEECLASGRHTQRVVDNYNDAVNTGIRSTPNSILIEKDGKKIAIPGSLPFSSVKTFLDGIIGGK